MKEIKQKFADKIEIVKQVSIEKKKVKIATLKPQKNHKMFEVNMKLQTITAATYDDPPVIMFEDAKQLIKKAVAKKITVNQDCVYISALNQKNVLKILKRDFGVNF